MSGKNWNDVLKGIKKELDSLSSFVERTKEGIDSLESTIRMSSERFPEASHQLTNVTQDLEKAANDIMTIVEGLMDEHDRTHTLLEGLAEWAGGLPSDLAGNGAETIKELDEINSKGKNDIMTIMTNLSFQDLTGQKLKKVIGSLSVVESKLLELTLYFGFADPGAERVREQDGDPELKGPDHPDALDQDAVEKLLKELRG